MRFSAPRASQERVPLLVLLTLRLHGVGSFLRVASLTVGPEKSASAATVRNNRPDSPAGLTPHGVGPTVTSSTLTNPPPVSVSAATLVVVRKDADGEDHAQRMRRIHDNEDPFLGLPHAAPYDRLVVTELQDKKGDSTNDSRGTEVRASLM